MSSDTPFGFMRILMDKFEDRGFNNVEEIEYADVKPAFYVKRFLNNTLYYKIYKVTVEEVGDGVEEQPANARGYIC